MGDQTNKLDDFCQAINHFLNLFKDNLFENDVEKVVDYPKYATKDQFLEA